MRDPRPITSPTIVPPASRVRAFTLTELLVAISIFVLLLAMSMPVFRTLTGSRSIEQSTNIVSAVLGRTRTDAIGLQQYRGVMFYLDANTGRVAMATMIETQLQPAVGNIFPAPLPTVEMWFDLDGNVDPVLLPSGIGLEAVTNAPVNAGLRTANGYLGYMLPNANMIQRPGPCVIFTPDGRLFTGVPGMVVRNGAINNTDMGNFIFTGVAPTQGYNWGAASVGLCIFESEPYLTQFPFNTTTDAWVDDAGYAANERAKETWLDNNATPFILNRYNGTLIKGE